MKQLLDHVSTWCRSDPDSQRIIWMDPHAIGMIGNPSAFDPKPLRNRSAWFGKCSGSKENWHRNFKSFKISMPILLIGKRSGSLRDDREVIRNHSGWSATLLEGFRIGSASVRRHLAIPISIIIKSISFGNILQCAVKCRSTMLKTAPLECLDALLTRSL